MTMNGIEQKNDHLQQINNQPGEIISRGCTGELLPPLTLPPDLAKLSQDWEPLNYEQRLADAKNRPTEECLRLLRSIGGVCKNAVELVRDFRPLIETCRAEFRQPGRRARVEGEPTWTEFISATFGFSPRRMQQLLADGNPSNAAPRSIYPKETRAMAKASSQEPEVSLKTLAVRLARGVVEQGFADRFPEALTILKIVNSKKSPLTLQSAKPVTEDHAKSQEPDPVSPSPATLLAAEIRPTSIPCGESQSRPGCFMCETGIGTCAMHEPLHAALMAEGKDEHDASLILRDGFARVRRPEAR